MPCDEGNNQLAELSWEQVAMFLEDNNLPTGGALVKGFDLEAMDVTESESDKKLSKEQRIKELIKYLKSDFVQVELPQESSPPIKDEIEDIAFIWTASKQIIAKLQAQLEEEKAKEKLARRSIEKIYRSHRSVVHKDSHIKEIFPVKSVWVSEGIEEVITCME